MFDVVILIASEPKFWIAGSAGQSVKVKCVLDIT